MNNPLLKLWYRTRLLKDGNESLTQFFQKTGVDKLFLIPRKTVIKWMLNRYYGPSFKNNQIGEISSNGIKFKLYNPPFFMLIEAASGKSYEPSVTFHLKTIIKDRKLCFLDIGANVGYYTSYVGNLNKKCEIYSFEPNKQYFNILIKNIKINDVNAIPYNIALSDETKEILFQGRSMKVTNKNNCEIVNSMPFDKIRDEDCIYPAVVKIDVHGAEGNVLYGMKKALKNDINHIYCEVHTDSQRVKYSTKDVLDIIKKSGFELYEMDRFRHYREPRFIKITNSLYDEIINENNWSNIHRRDERMIYATKEPFY